VTSCNASGGWSGAKTTSGSQSTGALTSSSAFSLTCTGSGGTASGSATVAVNLTTYTTNFDVDENPLSEGGKWLHTDPTLTTCKAVAGKAFGTQNGSGGFDDSNAYLTGFGHNYEVEGTVWLNPGLSGTGNREVEILLRWTDDGPLRSTAFGDTHTNGYEITVQHLGNYMNLGRFKGANLVGPITGFGTPKTGDRFRARIEGQRIRVWWNDVLQIDFTDSDASLQVTTGNPGIGFFVSGPGVPNTDFGFDSIIVRGL
jgi:hypothetical protein